MECFRLLLEYRVWIEHQFLRGIRDSMKAGSLWGMMRGVGGVRKSIRHSWLAKGLGLGLGLLCWGFKGVQEENTSEEASTLQIGSVAFPPGQRTSPQAVVMRQLRRWKRLWRRSLTHSHKRTSMEPLGSFWNSKTSALQGEKITSKGTRVSCVYYQ